jgi:hypothetical protein
MYSISGVAETTSSIPARCPTSNGTPRIPKKDATLAPSRLPCSCSDSTMNSIFFLPISR